MPVLSRSIVKLWQLQPSRFTSSITHTVNVQHKIEDSRKRALLGGGVKRIDAQHNRVRFFIIVVDSYKTFRENLLLAKESICWLIQEHSRNMTCSWSTRAPTSEWRRRSTLATVSLLAMDKLAEEQCSFSPKISPSSEEV